jgi:hypothetical protein
MTAVSKYDDHYKSYACVKNVSRAKHLAGVTPAYRATGGNDGQA